MIRWPRLMFVLIVPYAVGCTLDVLTHRGGSTEETVVVVLWFAAIGVLNLPAILGEKG